MKIGVIVAMDKEFELIRSLLTEEKEIKQGCMTFVEGHMAGKTVVLTHSGIGKVCSAVGAQELIRNFQLDGMINTGVAGGIDKALRVMDIVVGKSAVYHDVWCGEGNEYGQIQGMPARYSASPDMYEAAMKVKAEVRLIGGLICSGDQFITDAEALSRIKSKFPEGLAVDMESCSIAQVCYMNHIPFLSFRIISDTPGIEKHAEQYRDFWTEAPQRSFEVFRQFISML